MALLSVSSGLQAEILGFDVNLISGYRQDSFSEKSNLSKTSLKSAQALQAVGKAKMTFLNFFIFAEGSAGRVFSGRLNETGSYLEGHSKLKNGKINAFKAGAGYYFNIIPFCDWVRIGPMAGWSFDQQIYHGSCRSSSALTKYKNTWKGPWAGLDFGFQLCEFSLHASYEYHFALWKAERDFKDFSLLEGRIHSSHSYGQVLSLEGKWNFSLCWYLGMELKVQEWQASKGRWKNAARCLGLLSTAERNKEAKWRSLALQGEIGFNF
jgi:hypothetical protein